MFLKLRPKGKTSLNLTINLSHFEAALLFALIASIVLGVVTRKTDRERVQYGVKCFGYFMLALFAIGWAMKLGHG